MLAKAGEGSVPHIGFTPGLTIGRAATPIPLERGLRFAPVPYRRVFLMYAPSPASLYIRNIIPDGMAVPSPASLAYRGGAFGLRPLYCLGSNSTRGCAGMEKRLEEMTEEEREELRKFLQRFETELDAKVEVLLYETQDPAPLSEEERRMRARLLAGYVPLIDDDGELIYRKRAELRIQDIARFAAFLGRDAERRQREIGGLGESSEN
jgi:hypothetical protein